MSALDDRELGCDNVVLHKIEIGYHHLIKQMPSRTHRDKISQIVNKMEEQGIVQPSSTSCGLAS